MATGEAGSSGGPGLLGLPSSPSQLPYGISWLVGSLFCVSRKLFPLLVSPPLNNGKATTGPTKCRTTPTRCGLRAASHHTAKCLLQPLEWNVKFQYSRLLSLLGRRSGQRHLLPPAVRWRGTELGAPWALTTLSKTCVTVT